MKYNSFQPFAICTHQLMLTYNLLWYGRFLTSNYNQTSVGLYVNTKTQFVTDFEPEDHQKAHEYLKCATRSSGACDPHVRSTRPTAPEHATHSAWGVLPAPQGPPKPPKSSWKLMSAKYFAESTSRKVLCAKYLAQSTLRKVLSAKYFAQSTSSKILRAKYFAQSTLRKVLCANYFAQSTLRKVLCVKYFA